MNYIPDELDAPIFFNFVNLFILIENLVKKKKSQLSSMVAH